MPFTHEETPTDNSALPTQTVYDFPAPTDGRVAAVAVTVGVVGVILFGLITLLLLRLRRSPADETPFSRWHMPTSTDHNRPSTESKFSFMWKSPRPSHKQDNGSWDFVDPDPTRSSFITCLTKYQLPKCQLPKCQVPPLHTSPRSSPCSLHKGEVSSRNLTDTDIESPPPAYCAGGIRWPLHTLPKESLYHPTV